MSDIEFVDGPDDPPAPGADPVRPPWRRWAQPLLVALVAIAGAVVVVAGLGSDGPAPSVHQQEQPVAPSVHIYRYAPWHARAIPYGGGAYIY